MAEYEMQEMNLPNKDGKRILYPRLVQHGQASTDYIAKILSEKSSFTRGDIKGLLQELADELAYQMGQGKSVKLDGIGTFVPSLALRIDKERETGEADSTRRNARSIVVGSINFRAEKSLIHNTNYNCDLERSQQKLRRSSQKYTPEERLERAKQYLTGHPYMTVRNYVQLTGLRPTTASVELRKWAENPESGITTSGRGTHKVYIQR